MFALCYATHSKKTFNKKTNLSSKCIIKKSIYFKLISTKLYKKFAIFVSLYFVKHFIYKKTVFLNFLHHYINFNYFNLIHNYLKKNE